MNRINTLYIFLLFIFTGSALNATPGLGELIPCKISPQDTLKENQILYNGKMWRNSYSQVKGDQFLFSKDFLPGSLTINGESFKNIGISYDIYNDEILTKTNNGSILQLNKEMVDSFSIFFLYKTYKFIKIEEDSLIGIKGYVNVLYNYKSALYVKYKKEIDILAVDDKYDLFYQTQRIYFLKDRILHHINGKGDFLKDFNTNQAQIKDFMKKNKLRVSKKVPESFIPVIRYYDSISR